MPLDCTARPEGVNCNLVAGVVTFGASASRKRPPAPPLVPRAKKGPVNRRALLGLIASQAAPPGNHQLPAAGPVPYGLA